MHALAPASFDAEEIALINVEITNPEAIVNQHKGWFTGLAGTVADRLGMIDLTEKVQEAIVQRLFEELGAENVVISVSELSEDVAGSE